MLSLFLAGCGGGPHPGDGAVGTGGPAGVEEAGENAPPPDPPDESDAFFAEGTMYDFQLSIPDASRSSLATDPKTWVPATFTDDDGTWPVNVRLKGTTTFRPLSGKAAFKVDFHADDPTVRYHGLKRITLNSMLQDSSMLHEHVAYWLYRRQGIAAPRHTYAHVSVDGEDYGLYGVIETEDEQLLKRDYPDDHDGNLYEGNLSDFDKGSAPSFTLDEQGTLADPYTDLQAAIDTIGAAPAEGYVAALRSVFDFDQLMKMWAIDLVSGNVDGYVRLRNNFMVYSGATSLHLMPWGYDMSFQFHRSVKNSGEYQGYLIKRCASTPDCWAALSDTVETLMEDWEGGEFVTMASDESGLIQADCRTDARAELPCDVSHVVQFILDAPALVRADLGK